MRQFVPHETTVRVETLSQLQKWKSHKPRCIHILKIPGSFGTCVGDEKTCPLYPAQPSIFGKIELSSCYGDSCQCLRDSIKVHMPFEGRKAKDKTYEMFKDRVGKNTVMGDIHIHKHVQMQTYVYKCTDMHTMGSLMVHAFSLLNPEQKATHFLCVYLTGVELEHVQINFYKPRIASLNDCCRKDRKLTVDLGVVDQKALQRFHLATNVYFSMTYCQIQQISRVLYALLLQVTSIDIVCPKIILQISTVLEPSRNPSSLMSSSLCSRWKRTK